jgi:thiol:disulfide interchange protein
MSAIWCPSCRKLDKQVFSDEQVKIQLNQDFVYARHITPINALMLKQDDLCL